MTQDAECPNHPHGGATCLKVAFNQANGCAGVIWQHPANGWGLQPGGCHLTAAGKPTFWALGTTGGEMANFGVGAPWQPSRLPPPGRR